AAQENPTLVGCADAETGAGILVRRAAGHPARGRLRDPLQPGEQLLDGHCVVLAAAVPDPRPRLPDNTGTRGGTKTGANLGASAPLARAYPVSRRWRGRGASRAVIRSPAVRTRRWGTSGRTARARRRPRSVPR